MWLAFLLNEILRTSIKTTSDGSIRSVKDVIEFLLNNSSGIQKISYDELAEKGFSRNKGSETTVHSKESPYYSEIWESVNHKVGYKTLTHRQQFYIDHDWFFEFDEVLPRHKAVSYTHLTLPTIYSV